jgi:hypothetical protein
MSAPLVTRLKAAAERAELDRELAHGVSPSTNPELARRAEILRSRRVRRRLAAGLEHVLDEAVAPSRGPTAAIPVQRAEVLMAWRDLSRLARALRADPAPPVRAIAVASVLLADGTGPVFASYPHGTLAEAALQAAFLAEAG